MLSEALTNTEKGHRRMYGWFILDLFAPFSFKGTQGTLAVCRISLVQTEESFVPLSLCPWILGGRLLSPLNALPGKIVPVLLGMWPIPVFYVNSTMCGRVFCSYSVSRHSGRAGD